MDTFTHTESPSRWVRRLLDAPAGWRVLDAPARPLHDLAEAVPFGPYRDVLHGVPLGHPLHPVLVQVPVGCWLSSALLDCVPGGRRASAVLVAAGLAGAVPAAVAGWVDWAELDPPRRRTGLVHAAANSTGLVLYAASLWSRLRGHGLRGSALGMAGLTAVAAGAALGGHLSYRQAAGPHRASATLRPTVPEWAALGAVEEFPPGKPVRRDAGGLSVVVVREQDGFRVLAEQCGHLSGPLADGTVVDGCLRCPWHGSEFRLRDGEVIHGPATAPQPVFETRVLADHLEARLPGS
ncbi:Rieske (2Fe-2S) protein [Kitasatospora camelliae]|uniref:Rieske (2Fe-2S) protein n=1 Tax=Kitasatospora camelliae TaxID=3156397 RepID=A0AAU8JS93_9ACTN